MPARLFRRLACHPTTRSTRGFRSASRIPTLLSQRCYIDGRWTDAEAGATTHVVNPATGARIGTTPRMGAAETKLAIDAAAAAFPAWRAKMAKERSAILRKWFELMLANSDDLALILTSEQGKPLAESKGEIAIGAAYIEWFAEEAKRVYGDVIPTIANDRRLVVVKEPVGVCAAITPWNFPSSMITRKVAPALAAGCTVVIKPAQATPYSALALAELAHRAGFPPGVLNVITGDARAIGGEMCANPTVRKLSFTGSTEIGRQLMKQVAPTVKKISLELGGNAPFVVFDDADLDAAADGAIIAKYRNAGQTCVCTNRFFVHDSIYDAFAAKLVERVKALKVGPGTEAGVTQGPLIDAAAVTKVEEHIADATAQGARVATGGKRHALARHVLRADGADRRDGLDADLPRGDLRSRRAAHPLFVRRRGDRAREPHRIRARFLLLLARYRPDLARGRGARIRDGRRQHRAHHH